MTATWTQPRTWSVGELTTAAWMNQYVRDEFDFLKTPPNSGRVQFAANFTTTSLTYVDVTGVTATITTFGGGVFAFFRCTLSNSAPAGTSFQILVDGSVSALLGTCFINSTGNNLYTIMTHIPAIAAGSHIFKLQTKNTGGTTTILGTTGGAADPEFYVWEGV